MVPVEPLEEPVSLDEILESRAHLDECHVHPGVVEWKKGENTRTGWVVARTSVVAVTDLARVGLLIALLAEAEAVVHGPSWELDAKHPAHDDTRRDAAEDALRRADAYAAALGVTLGSIAWASEPGLRPGGPGAMPPGVVRAAAMAAGRPEIGVLAVTAHEITVRASLEVGYTIAAE